MFNLLSDFYAVVFCRKFFSRFNRFICFLGLRGIGILNYKSARLGGEPFFLKNHFMNLRKGVVFDVGANVGNYSKEIRKINEYVDIYCFEPHPRTFQKLLVNVNALNIKSVNVGVGNSTGKLALYDYANDDGSEHASLYKDVIEVIHKGKAIAHEVNVVRLSTFADQQQIDQIFLLKIDTEGHELEVLKGFESFIRNNKVELIHFEFNKLNVVSRIFFKDFWDFLPNYDFYRMVQDGLVPIKSYDPLFCEIFAYQNIVAKLKVQSV